MLNKITIGLLVILYLCFVRLDARAVDNFADIASNFRLVSSLGVHNIKVPTVLEVSLPLQLHGGMLAVYDKTASVFVPNIVLGEIERYPVPVSVTSDYSDTLGINSISDGDYTTYKDFDLPSSGMGSVETSFLFAKEMRSSSIKLSFGQYVALPQSVTIKAKVGGEYKTVLSKYKLADSTVNFKETVSEGWEIILDYSQPVRINEITIINLDNVSNYQATRFLADPNHEYEIYADPIVSVYPPVGEIPNLHDTNGIKKVSLAMFADNKLFKIPDRDGDGVVDLKDNCVNVANSDQLDIDQNGRGDTCDDFDRDGVINSLDNCMDKPNKDQTDIDNDKRGDVCDGEESRLTEKYPFLVWAGFGFAFFVFMFLFYVTFKRSKDNPQGIDKSA
jgi:hypothetical protein